MGIGRAIRTASVRGLCGAVLLGSLASAATGAQPSARAATPRTRGAQSISHLNNETAHYTEDAQGRVHVQLYVSPVGVAGDIEADHWRFRSLALAPDGHGGADLSDGPYMLSLADKNPEAAIVSVDGLPLDVAVAGINGVKPRAVAGTVSRTAVTYAAFPGLGIVSAVRSTVAGFDVRFTLTRPLKHAVIALALQAGVSSQATIGYQFAGASLQQQDDLILVQSNYQSCGGAGCQTLAAPSLSVRPAIVRDSTPAPGLPAFGPTTMRLTGHGAAGRVTITVDPAWLANPARVYPITVDVPVATASDAAQSGLFGTIQSCAPTMAAQEARVLVGAAKGCTDHGSLYFSVTQLMYLYNYQIVSATLHLDTPHGTRPSGMLIYVNAPGAVPHPQPAVENDEPSWSTAPPRVPGAAGSRESRGAGHWHVWNVTAAVRSWARDEQTNSGLTLIDPAHGPPTVVASPLGAGDDGPASAPYLDITLAPVNAP